MIVKTYSAESATAALKLIRAELGGDAVILKTTKGSSQNGRPAVFVTACAELSHSSASPNRMPAFEKSANGNSSAHLRLSGSESSTRETHTNDASGKMSGAKLTQADPSQLQPASPAQRGFQLLSQIDQKLDLLLSRPDSMSGATSKMRTSSITEEPSASSSIASDKTLRALLSRGYALETAEQFNTRFGDRLTSGESIESCERELLAERTIEFSINRGEVVVVLGLPGSGKSSLIATLAQRITFGSKLPVRLCSLDATRIAATDELATYAELLGADIVSTQQIGSYAEGVTLIDTPGINSEKTAAAIHAQIKGISRHKTMIAVPATVRADAHRTMLRSLSQFKIDGIVFTMTDQHSAIPLAVGCAIENEFSLFGRISAGNGASELLGVLDGNGMGGK